MVYYIVYHNGNIVARHYLVSFQSLRVFLEFVFSQPPGRPIPVETGSGERLPSIDTRAPRMRDLDAIIEVEHVSNFS